MKIWIRRSLAGVAVLLAVTSVAIVVAAQLGERKRHRHIDVAVTPVAYRSDAASVERGGYLFRSRGCAECHGAAGTGTLVIDDGGLKVRSPNITRAANSAVAAYTPVDWVRTIRHGIKADGQPIFLMPSEDYSRLTDADLASIVAYVRQLPAAPGEPALVQLPLPVKVLYAVGMIRDAAEKIDHRLPPAQPVAEGISAAHGEYVANSCIGCHRAGLVGGKIAGAPPSWPPAARLAPGEGSVLPRYRDAQAFMAMIRTGKRPDGSAVSMVMPFATLREMSDLDLRALYLYLTTMQGTR